MRARILLDGERPKVRPSELRGIVEAAGMEVGRRRADIGVVVGGDGIFGRFGRTEDVPLLFVGVRSKRPTDSKARLAEAYLDELPEVLRMVRAGDYEVVEHKRLQVIKNGRSLGEVFTDVYLERGADSNCLRYRVVIDGEGTKIDESAIGDGVVISTPAGATGYYSYPDRVRGGTLDPSASSAIPADELGVCHIVPTFTERAGSVGHPLRYTVPWGCVVKLSLSRRADARVFGTAEGRSGIRVGLKDVVVVGPAEGVTRTISVKPHA